MKNNIIKSIKKIKISLFSEFIILAIVLVTPLYFNYFYASSVELNKTVFFRVSLFFLLFFSVWQFAFEKLKFNKNRLFNILFPVSIFFISITISLFFSVDFNSSWFGSYDRNEGLISYLFYGLWLFLLLFNLNDIINSRRLYRLFLAIIISASLVSVYAIFQFFGWDFVNWSEPAYLTKRAFSSLGQPNYLACWLVMVMPISAYLLYDTKHLTGRILFGVLFFLQLVALFMTGSRSAFLAFFIVSLGWLFLFFYKEKDFFRKYFLKIILVVLTLFIGFAVLLLAINPERFNSLSSLKKGSTSVRIQLWQDGFKAFAYRPLFGYGLENQKEAYVKYYQPDFALYARPNTYSDRAHNLFLDILLTSGLVGLGAFIYLLWSVFKSLGQSYLKNNNKLSVFLIWSLVAYLFILLFNFSVTVTNIYFFLLLALAYLSLGPIFIETTEQYKKPAPYLLILGSLIILFYGVITEMKVLEADFYFNKSLAAIAERQYFSALLFNEYLLESQPNSLIKNYYGQAISLRLLEGLPSISDRSSYYVVDKYLNDFSEHMKDQSFESRFVKAFILGVTHNRLQSEKIFTELSLISPFLPKLYLAWGDVYLYNNNLQQAKIKFEKTKSLLPSLDNPDLNFDHKKQLEYYYSIINNRLERANTAINQ